MSAIMAFAGKMALNLVGETITRKMSKQKSVSNPAKGHLQSKTSWGVALMALGPIIAPRLGLGLDQFAELISALSVIVGAVLGFVGRQTAKGPIGQSTY